MADPSSRGGTHGDHHPRLEGGFRSLPGDPAKPDPAPLGGDLESDRKTRLVPATSEVRVQAGGGVSKDGILQAPRIVTVVFHSHSLSFRGSDNALWDYAVFNETVLGNQSVICHPEAPASREPAVLARWEQRFPLIPYRNRSELPAKIKDLGAKVLYQIKPGPFDGFLVPGILNSMHAMFLSDEFHGDRFAYVSRWASRVMTGHENAFVPHFVPRLASPENLRVTLGIPGKARVFGRHGAADTFNIPFARRAVLRHAQTHPEDHFVFLNTERFGPSRCPGNIHFLPGTADPAEKAKFLATCDAMLHARLHGETFGLAVGEFAVLGKPVLTYGASRERAHLDMLGERALIYTTENQLLQRLAEFQPVLVRGSEYEAWADANQVMQLFFEKFLP